jgi:hypothetical protein
MAEAGSRRFDWIVTGLALLLPVLVFLEVAGPLVEQDAASGGPMRDAAFFPEVVAWALLLPIAANVFRLVRTSRAPAGQDPGAVDAPGAETRPETGPGIGPETGPETKPGTGPRSQRDTGLALQATGLFVAYLLVLPWAGYYLATPLLLVVLMRMFGSGWIAALLAAAGMTLAVAFVFEGLLDVVLPLGLAKFTLFG